MSPEVAVEMYGGRWKRYPAYRDSGVEWIGEVPEHWELKKLKYLVTGFLKYGANESAELEDPNLPRYIRITDFGEDGKLKQDTFKSLPLEIAKDYLLENGDILFARSGATVGKTFQFKNHEKSACFAGYLIKASPDKKKILSDYLYLFTKSNSYEMWKNNVFIQATIQNIGADKYNSLTLSFPPLPEQRAIAAFLNRETGRIDALIEKKERQIELLQEKRAALISHAVTKGLDPDVKMKDSGVEWLGEVPEGWDVKRLKYCATLINEKVDGRKSDLPYTGLEHIESWTGRLISSEEISSSEGQSNCYEFGDVLFGKLRPYLAKVFRAKDHGICTGELLVLRPKDVSQDYLFRYMLSRDFVFIVDSSTYGAKMPRASWDFIGDLPVLLPSETEQRAIAAFLDRETGRIDTLTTKVRESISKLREYRTALISAAVTGKIDVREVV